MTYPRWMHKIYAKVNGLFWIPCYCCGEYWGGHEVTREYKNLRGFPVGWKGPFFKYKSICPMCTERGEGVLVSTYNSWEK